MSWTIPALTQAELEKAEVVPIIAASIHVPPLGWLTVIDWTAGAGETITVDANTPEVITEGVDFTAAGSNAATAQAIAEAWNSDINRLVASQAKAIWRGGATVAFRALNASLPAISIATSNASAWDEVLPQNPTTFDFCSHSGVHHPALTEHIPVLATLAGLEWELDPVTREITIPRPDLVFSGGQEIRELMNWYSLRRAPVDLLVGAYYEDGVSSSTSDFATLPTLFVHDAVPKPGQVSLKLVDALGDIWRDRTVTGAWVGWHPLQIVEDILTRAFAIDGVHYDSASLDPTIDDQRSHFCLSRYWDEQFGLQNSIGEGRKAGELISELLALTSGTFRPQQTGPYEFLPWDRYASAVGSLRGSLLTGHDIDEVDQETSLGDQINAAVISFARGVNGKQREHVDSDALAYFETEGQLSDFQHRTDWLNGLAETYYDLGSLYQHSGAGTSVTGGNGSIYDDTSQFPVHFAGRQGFSGSQSSYGFGLAMPGQDIGGSTGRYVVLRLFGLLGSGQVQRSDLIDEMEYLLVSAWTRFSALPDDSNVQASPNNGVPGGTSVLEGAALAAVISNDAASTLMADGVTTIGDFFGMASHGAPFRAGRGIFGSTPPANWQNPAYLSIPQFIGVEDVTIQFYLARETILRFRDGGARIKVRSPLGFMAFDLGEFVTLDDDFVIAPGRGDGADDLLIWEVCGKKLDFFGDTPGIEWTLVQVRDDAFIARIVTPALPTPPVVSLASTPISLAVSYVVDADGNLVEDAYNNLVVTG